MNETTIDPAAGTGSFFTPPEAIDAVMANPPMGETGGGINMIRRAVGIISNERHILAWNYLDGNDIRVSADRIGLAVDEDGAMRWHISLQTSNGTTLEGVASCGRWCCNHLVRELRNAMTGRKNKVRNTHKKYKARKAAERAAEAAAGAVPEQQAYDSKAAEPVPDKPAEPIAPEEELGDSIQREGGEA